MYIKCDQKALGIRINFKARIFALFVPSIWKFEYLLRKTEYLVNSTSKRNIIKNIYKNITYIRYLNLGIKLGFSIPLNVFGPGLALCHVGTIVINGNSKFGANARIHAGVNVGTSAGLDEKGNYLDTNAPIFGDNVYLGPGCKIFGKINIGNDVAIGANAVVNKDVPNHVTVAGVPAKIISEKGSEGIFIKGYEKNIIK